MKARSVQQTPVLVAGGGLTGLSTALFVQQQTTPFILIEREQGPLPAPLLRARGWAVRNMELFRSLELQDSPEKIAAEAWEKGCSAARAVARPCSRSRNGRSRILA